MADPTIAEAISLLTKVSADTAQRLKSLEKEVRSSISGKGNGRSKGSTEPREPRQIVEAPKDVVVTNFGPEAEADLAAAFGRETEVALEKQQKKKHSSCLDMMSAFLSNSKQQTRHGSHQMEKQFQFPRMMDRA